MDAWVERLRRALSGAGDLVLPGRCAACGGVGTPLCEGCGSAVRRESGPRRVPVAAEVRAPSCWAGAAYDGPLRRAVGAHKDDGRRDLRRALAAPLALALDAALREDPVVRRTVAAGEPVLVVPVPTTRRSRSRRGDDPVADLVAAAVARVDPAGGLVLHQVLRHVRRVADQGGLDRAARLANLDGALEVRPLTREAVRGRVCVVVDDVVTTGSTLAEAARALRVAGAHHVVGAAAAATARRQAATDPRRDRRGAGVVGYVGRG